jgi:hypothetical protein
MKGGTMTKNKSPEREWQRQLIDDYYDYRWKQVLEPLYQEFQRWKAGERSPAEMDQAIHTAHKESQRLYGFFSEGRDSLANWIRMDQEWFEPWLAAHPAPPGIRLIPPIFFRFQSS